MKTTKYHLLILLCQPLWLLAQTGSSCGSPYIIPLDGTAHSYSTTSNTGGSVVCTNGTYPSTSPVTWFSFTTNSSAEMPLMDITAGDSSSCEVAMYTACNGGGALQTFSSMCFDRGWGLWSPAQNFALQANTTYHLRIKTQTGTQIKITAQSYTPSNNTCAGATPVDANFIHDNNACNRPSSEVTPQQLCALTLENTAFYQFYVASQGAAVINISSIACDNGNYNNDNGIQIGFFTGTCGGLVPLNCYAGVGPFVQATTPILDAGTKVYVAIDGNAGSNCQYNFQAMNAFKVLSDKEFKNFSVWKSSKTNVLKWIAISNKTARFTIERSANGSDFTILGEVTASANGSSVTYNFEDLQPLQIAYYRIKQVKEGGEISMSNTIRAERKNEKAGKIRMINPVRNALSLQIDSDSNETIFYSIISSYGQRFDHGKLVLLKGINKVSQTISNLPAGNYVLNVSSPSVNQSIHFIKVN